MTAHPRVPVTGARRAIAVAVAGLLLVPATPAAAGPGRPGDGFEGPVVPPGPYVVRTAGETFGRWAVTRGTIDQIGRGYWQAADNRQSVDLNGRGEGAVRTTMATGGPATLDFASTSGPTAYGPVVDKVSAVRCLTVACG